MTDYDDSNTEYCPNCENTVNISQHGVCSECGLNIYDFQLGEIDLNNNRKQSKSPPTYESTVKKGPHKNSSGNYQVTIHGFKDGLEKDVICTKHARNIKNIDDFELLQKGVPVKFYVHNSNSDAIFAKDLELIQSKTERASETTRHRHNSTENEASYSMGKIDRIEKLNGQDTAFIKLPNGKEVTFRRTSMDIQNDFGRLMIGSLVEFNYSESKSGIWGNSVRLSNKSASYTHSSNDYGVDQVLIKEFLSHVKSQIDGCTSSEDFERFTHLVLKLLCGPTHTHFIEQSRQRALPDGYVYLSDLCIFYDSTLEDKNSRDKNKSDQKESFLSKITADSYIEKIGNNENGFEEPTIAKNRHVWFIVKDTQTSPLHKLTRNEKSVQFAEVNIYDLISILEARLVERRDLNEIPSLSMQLMEIAR